MGLEGHVLQLGFVLYGLQHVNISACNKIVRLGGDEYDGLHVLVIQHVVLEDALGVGLHACRDSVHLVGSVETNDGHSLLHFEVVEVSEVLLDVPLGTVRAVRHGDDSLLVVLDLAHGHGIVLAFGDDALLNLAPHVLAQDQVVVLVAPPDEVLIRKAYAFGSPVTVKVK